MAFHYPNGRRFVPQAMEVKKSPLKKISYSNRGKTLEDDLNETNQYYLAHGIAVIHKKPTPIQIVDVTIRKEVLQSLKKLISNKHRPPIIMVFIKESTLILRQRKRKTAVRSR